MKVANSSLMLIDGRFLQYMSSCLECVINRAYGCLWDQSHSLQLVKEQVVTSQGSWALEELFGFRGRARRGGVSWELSWKTGTCHHGSVTSFCLRATFFFMENEGAVERVKATEVQRCTLRPLGGPAYKLPKAAFLLEGAAGLPEPSASVTIGLYNQSKKRQKKRGCLVLHMRCSEKSLKQQLKLADMPNAAKAQRTCARNIKKKKQKKKTQMK